MTYEGAEEVPSIGGDGGKPGKENPLNNGGHHGSGTQPKAEGSDAGGGSGGETTEGPEAEPGSESEGEGHKGGGVTPSGGGGNNPPNSSGGGGGKPSNGGGSKSGLGENKPVESSTGTPVSSESSSSSPVVPILIAVVVLAAISIGVVLYRQRKSRQGPDSRGSVSSSNAS